MLDVSVMTLTRVHVYQTACLRCCFIGDHERFEDAVATAQTACQLDPSNREVANLHRRAKAAAAARLRGNDLFKAAKFAEACAAYGEGLESEAGNAVLLCNRAACHAKLGRYEKAVEDCSGALVVRPAYSKARLRRADCNVKVRCFLFSFLLFFLHAARLQTLHLHTPVHGNFFCTEQHICVT